MKPVERQKVCSHCDGRISIEADTCPYCGTVLLPQEEQASSGPLFGNQSLQESLTSLYTPPYSNRNAAFMKKEKEEGNKFKAPLKKENSSDNQFSGAFGKTPSPYASSSLPPQEHKAEEPGSFLALLFVLLGANLLTVGLMQCFFSDEGFLRLEWSSKYWFVYCLFALPLLYFGIKKAKDPREPAS